MKSITAHCSQVGVVTAILWSILVTSTYAQRPNMHVGQWLHVTVEEPTESRQSCRYVDVITRTYDLQGALNGGVEGGYFLQSERYWFLGATDGCHPSEGQNPPRFFRNDLWIVFGERAGEDSIKVTGQYAKCLGACANSINVVHQFKTVLIVRNGVLEDVEQKDKLSTYRPADVVLHDAQSAGAAFLELFRPLLAGNCHMFYLSSLDPEQQAVVPQDKFCEVASLISQFLPPALYDEPLFAFSASIGSLRASGPMLFGYGDVLVQKVLTVSGGGGKVVNRAILRKQSDARWKILRLIP